MSKGINRRSFLKQCAVTAGSIGVLNSVGNAGVQLANQTMKIQVGQKRPNIVFILIDDMGWNDVGFMGSKYYETPNTDKLASQGMVFTNAYANAANCAPTRACFLTGQYSPRHGVITVGSSARGDSSTRRLIPVTNDSTLNSEHVTIAEAMKPVGYASACIGKWHMGNPPLDPIGQGFDVNVQKSDYPSFGITGDPKNIYAFTNEAMDFIEQHKSDPFFLYLSHDAVHSPTEAKPDLTAYYQTPEKVADQTTDPDHNDSAYAAMIHSVDEGIGHIMQKLKELDLEGNTIVIFFSDNGGLCSETDSYPLNGSKGMYYEGGIREPMIVRWPGVVKPGTTCDVPVIGTDFFPTFLDIAGAKKTSWKLLDGETLVPLFKGGTSLQREAIFWHFPAYLQEYNCAAMDEARDPLFRTRPVSVIRKGKWKLLQFFEEWLLDGGWGTIETNNAIELYDLDNDIGEQHNLADPSHPNYNLTKRNELLNELIAWQNSVGAPNSLSDMPANPDYTG